MELRVASSSDLRCSCHMAWAGSYNDCCVCVQTFCTFWKELCLNFAAILDDKCGEEPNGRACDLLDNAKCGEDSSTCICSEGYEAFEGLCACPEAETEEAEEIDVNGQVIDAPGGRKCENKD